MSEWLDSILEVISYSTKQLYDKPYYILPFILASVVLYIQFKKGNNLLNLAFLSFEIFSITTSVEYVFMFLFIGPPPESLAVFDKIIFMMGTLIAFLVIFYHTTEGSWIGNRINDILNKYFIPKHTPKTDSPFMEQLEKLRSLKENIMSGNKQQVNNVYQAFLDIGSSLIMLLTKIFPENDKDITNIQSLYDCCKNDFKDMFKSHLFNDEQTVKTTSSFSEFIGTVDGFIKTIQMNLKPEHRH